MKNYSFLLGALAVCVGAFASCQKEAVSATPQHPKKVSIGFTAALAPEEETKTSMTISGNTATFHWDATDRLKVRQVYYRGNTMYPELSESGVPSANNGVYSLSADFTVVSTAPDAHFEGGYRYLYQGFYPASQTSMSSSGKITVKLPSEQKPRSEQLFDEKADILYSDAVYAKSQRAHNISSRTINGLTFHRLSAIGVMKLSGSPSILSGTGAAVQYVEFISNQDKALAGNYSFSVTSPNTPGSLSAKSSSIKLDFTDITTNRNNFMACFSCLPASCSGYTVRVVTTKGTYEKSFSDTKTFTAGQATFFTVNMSNATFTPKVMQLMTYNVAAFRLYDQFNLKHTIYKDNGHYWKRDSQSGYVLYTEADYENNKRDNTGELIITHAAGILATEIDVDTPTLIGFNELDCNLRRTLTVTADVRKQNGTKTPITQSWYIDHGFQLKQINERLTATIEGSSWWHSFGKAKTYGQTVQNSVLLQNIANGEMQRAYGNGVMANKPILSSQTKSLGNGGNSDEEVRCVTVLETEDCVFASVHMGGVHGDATMRVNVIKNQAEIMTNWFIQKFNNYSKPVFVCGDFNAYPNEIPEIMSSSHWTLLSRTDTSTHSSDKCLDYIFSFKHAAQVNVESSKVIQSVGANVAPHGIGTVSDHVPILVKVSLVL